MVKGFPGKLKKKKSKKFTKDFNELFLAEGTEPITEDLIDELVVDKGWSEVELRRYQQEGASYSRPRNSILYPPEFGSPEDF